MRGLKANFEKGVIFSHARLFGAGGWKGCIMYFSIVIVKLGLVPELAIAVPAVLVVLVKVDVFGLGAVQMSSTVLTPAGMSFLVVVFESVLIEITVERLAQIEQNTELAPYTNLPKSLFYHRVPCFFGVEVAPQYSSERGAS